MTFMIQQQGRAWCVCALLLTAAAFPQASRAQTATISGTLASFDVVNASGQDAHGFEIQLEGAFVGDLYYTAFGGRYGNPQVVTYATGVRVRYESLYDANAHQFTATTPAATTDLTSWQNCYFGGAGYAKSGCEHFGQSMRAIPPDRTVTVTGRWLTEDTANPGTLIPVAPQAAIPFATWSVAPFTTFAVAPIVVAQVEAP